MGPATCAGTTTIPTRMASRVRSTYPSGKFTSPVVGEIVAGAGCHATDRYTPSRGHYWKTEVEWCDKAINTAGDQWLGTGRRPGLCQSFKDASHVYPALLPVRRGGRHRQR